MSDIWAICSAWILIICTMVSEPTRLGRKSSSSIPAPEPPEALHCLQRIRRAKGTHRLLPHMVSCVTLAARWQQAPVAGSGRPVLQRPDDRRQDGAAGSAADQIGDDRPDAEIAARERGTDRRKRQRHDLA